MLSKSATMMLGLINRQPLNAYEIIKVLECMNVKWWYDIANSTIYATLRTLDNKGLIVGVSEKNGNMPYRTVYSISDKGKMELKNTLTKSILSFDFDTNLFSIAAFFLDFFELDEQISLLKQRNIILTKYITGIENWILHQKDSTVPFSHIVIVERMADLAKTELSGTNKLIEILQTN
ncbi:PadR family transcriptional regulator [Bacteroides congonensis]|jgi:DNA-binding PadR family transcriptional regulator|uniref:PadR family transcriptional regulator n=1 Tax=Bacteroides congonensis TaxID=1871006 RepID=UPI0032198446